MGVVCCVYIIKGVGGGVQIFFEIICFSDSTGKINDFSFYLSEKYAFLAI